VADILFTGRQAVVCLQPLSFVGEDSAPWPPPLQHQVPTSASIHSGMLRSWSSALSESLRRLFRPAIAVTRWRFSKRGHPCGDLPLSLAALRRRCEPLDELLLRRLFCSTLSNVITRWSVLVSRQPLQLFDVAVPPGRYSGDPRSRFRRTSSLAGSAFRSRRSSRLSALTKRASLSRLVSSLRSPLR